MAGSQSADDNPVAINVTAMVDVIFCLCLFFMCSMHFKQLEGKIDAWLPKGHGNQKGAPDEMILEEVRILLRWDPSNNTTSRRVGNLASAPTDDALMADVLVRVGDYRRLGKPTPPIVIDAMPDVSWKDVIHTMDLCKSRGLEQITLTEPLAMR